MKYDVNIEMQSTYLRISGELVIFAFINDNGDDCYI